MLLLFLASFCLVFSKNFAVDNDNDDLLSSIKKMEQIMAISTKAPQEKLRIFCETILNCGPKKTEWKKCIKDSFVKLHPDKHRNDAKITELATAAFKEIFFLFNKFDGLLSLLEISQNQRSAPKPSPQKQEDQRSAPEPSPQKQPGEISFTMEQMSVFIKNLNNYMTEKCNDFVKSLFDSKEGPSCDNGLQKTIQKCISKMKIGELVNVFEEKNEQQQAEQKLKKKSYFTDGKKKQKDNEVNANEFLEKLLEKMLEKESVTGNASLKQKLNGLSVKQHLWILRQLFTIGHELVEKQLEHYGWNGNERNYSYTVIELGYHEELRWKFSKITNELFRILDDYPIYWCSLKEYCDAHFLPEKLPKQKPPRIDLELSLSQIAIFVANMDNFLQSKCGNSEEYQIENILQQNTLGRCISQLKISEIGDFFINQLKNKKFLEILVEKIVSHLRNEQDNRQEFTMNLSDDENLIVLLKLFKWSNFLNLKLLNVLWELSLERKVEFPINLYDTRIYRRNMKICALVEYFIEQILKKKFKESFNAMYYDYQHFQIKMNFDKKNIYGVKLDVVITTSTMCSIITIIGQFIKANCKQDMWKYVENEEKLKKCAKKVNFHNLGIKFYEDKRIKKHLAYYFTNLIGSILKAEGSDNEAEKQQLNPYDMEIYCQIEKVGLEMKVSVLRGLLQFGRLFTEKFGALVMENIDLDNYRTMFPYGPTSNYRTMIWKGIPITIKEDGLNKYTFYGQMNYELKTIKEKLTEAGLIKAMDKELRENRVQLLRNAGVPEEQIKRK